MALTERQEYKIEIIPPFRVIHVRRADIIERDGVEVARSYHRSSFVPGTDVTAETAIVEQVANAIWTPAVVAAYTAEMENRAAETDPSGSY